MKVLYPLLTLLLAVIITASPNPVGNKEPRMAIQVKPVAGAEGQKPVGGIEDTANYLLTLDRSITLKQKDHLLDLLMREGAVVKQVFDYRVFKGLLFTVPSSSDRGLTSWQSSLLNVDGVKIVEEDQIVKTT